MRLSLKFPVLVLTALVSVANSRALAREFTDVQGRKLDGELVSVSGGQATIKRTADGKVFAVAVSQFSPEDQKAMADFAADNAHFEFEVKLVRHKESATKTKENNVTHVTEKWVYKVEVGNRSTADADDLHVDYWLFSKPDDGKIQSGPHIQEAGSTNIGVLKRAGTFQFQTKPLVLSSRLLDGDFYFENGAKNKAQDSAGGVAMRFFRGTKEVFAWATDPELLKTANGRAKTTEQKKTSQ